MEERILIRWNQSALGGMREAAVCVCVWVRGDSDGRKEGRKGRGIEAGSAVAGGRGAGLRLENARPRITSELLPIYQR